MTGIHLMIGNVSLVGDAIMMIVGMVVVRFMSFSDILKGSNGGDLLL
jgi:hypothetical protein